jgi:hypothetical protein
MSSQGYPPASCLRTTIRLRGGCIVATRRTIPGPFLSSQFCLITAFSTYYPSVSSSSNTTTDLGVTGSSPVGRATRTSCGPPAHRAPAILRLSHGRIILFLSGLSEPSLKTTALFP